jgi:hypothetical protein
MKTLNDLNHYDAPQTEVVFLKMESRILSGEDETKVKNGGIESVEYESF